MLSACYSQNLTLCFYEKSLLKAYAHETVKIRTATTIRRKRMYVCSNVVIQIRNGVMIRLRI